MKKLKIIILIVIVSIFLLLFLLFAINNKVEHDMRDKIGDPGEQFEYDENNFIEVDSQIEFYTVRDCIYKYYNVINRINNIYTDTGIDYETMICDMLDKEYISKNQITKENIKNFIDNEKKYIMFEPLEMKVLENSNLNRYVVYGYIQDLDKDKERFIKYDTLIVNLDNVDKTFSIEPVKDKQYNEIKIENENTLITENENNKYTDSRTNYGYIAQQYMKAYKDMFLTNAEIAYNHLDEAYREKRFQNVEEYQKYIEKNLEELSEVQLNQYLVNNYEDYTEYVCTDDNNNYYIFKEKSPMNFTLLLDTYTLESEKFTTEYNKVNDQHKVMMNIDKWVQMLNNRDYKAAYEVLDKTFREENFGTVDDFEEYMRTIYPYFYDLEFGELEEEEGLYIQQITLKNKNDVQDTGREQHIIMQLEKGTTNFVMSFRRVNR